MITLRNRNKKINFKIKDFIIKEIDPGNMDEIGAILKLRHDIYCNELKWVEPNPAGIEQDNYDNLAVYFGVFAQDGLLLGTSRIIPSNSYGFMVDNEFKRLVDPKKIKNIDLKNTVEVSRLAVRSNSRGNKINGRLISEYLYLGMYKWSKVHRIKYWIFVVEKSFLDYLINRYSMVLKLLGEGYKFEDGIFAVPALLELREINKIIKKFLRDKIINIFNLPN